MARSYTLKRRADQQALLHLALSYHSWRALVLEAGLGNAAAAESMVGAIEGA